MMNSSINDSNNNKNRRNNNENNTLPVPQVLITPMTNSLPSHKNDDKCNRKGLEAHIQPNHL
ncbi:hypothetical protein GIB67_030577, partial [Kingdonia uniflora]